MTQADVSADIFFMTADYPTPDWKRTKWRWSPMEARLFAQHRNTAITAENEWNKQ